MATKQQKPGFRPLHDRVLVEPDPEETMTKGGLHIPDNVKQKSVMGTVVRVGPGFAGTPLEVKEGDRVSISKHTGTPLIRNDKLYYVVREGEILGVDE